MALDIGRLVGYLDLDDKQFEGKLGALEGKISGKAKMFAAAGLVVGAAVAGALITGLNNALDLDSANAKLTAQLDLTKDQAAVSGKVAGELYANNYGDSLEQVSGAVGDVMGSIDGMKDANARTVEDMTGKLLNLQKAFEIDTSRSAAVAGQMVKAGLVDNANEAVDLLTAALQKVPPAMRENIVDAIDEYGPFFDQLGFKGQEAMNALVLGASKGQYGIDKAGDAIKEFTIRATDLNDTGAQQALKDLGFNGEDMANKILAGGDSAFGATQQIVQGLLSTQDPAKQAALATSLFGTQLEDLNKGQISDFLSSLNGTSDALGKTSGAAADMGAKLNAGIATSVEGVTRQFQGLMTDAVQPLLPVLSSLMSFLADNPWVFTAVAVVAGVLAVAFIGLTAATWAMNTALLANPITWIVMAIVAAVALLVAAVVLIVQNWDPIVSWITGVFGAVWGWLQGVVQGFIDWWNGLWGGFGEVVGSAIDGVIGFFTETLPQAFSDFLSSAGEWFANLPQMLYDGLVNGLAFALAALYIWFIALPLQILSWLSAAATWLVNTGMSLLRGLGQGIVAGYQAVVAFFTALPGNIVNFIVSFATLLISWGMNLLRGLASGITSGAVAVWSFLSALPGRVVGFVTSLPGLLISFGSTMLSGLANGARNGAAAVWGFLSGLPGQILSALGNLGSTLLGAGRDLMSGLLSGIRGGLSNILGAIAGMAGDIMGKFKSILGIHSPSTVFRGFGQNIGEGLLLGLADLKPEVAMSIQAMANLQPTSATAYSYQNSYSGQTTLYVDKMGYDPEEIVDEIDKRKQHTQELVGLDVVRVAL